MFKEFCRNFWAVMDLHQRWNTWLKFLCIEQRHSGSGSF